MTDYYLGGTTSGGSSLSTPRVNLTIAFSGHVDGATTLSDGLVVDTGGTVAGLSMLSTPFVEVIRNFRGTTYGVTTPRDALPYAVYGTSTLQLVMPEITREPRAILACACPGPKEFRWGQVFQRGDLTLIVSDPSGTPLSPYEVTYTLYRMLAPSLPHQVGPTGRRPVMQKTGEYYATGTAGETGQPGDWQIVWTLRRSFNGPTTTEVFAFRVVDAISSPILGDPTCRKRKYGWSD